MHQADSNNATRARIPILLLLVPPKPQRALLNALQLDESLYSHPTPFYRLTVHKYKTELVPPELGSTELIDYALLIFASSSELLQQACAALLQFDELSSDFNILKF